MTEAEKHDTVLDTGAEQLGQTYAQALIGAANNAGVADQVIEQLNQLVDEYLAGNPSLQAAFSSPRVDEAEKVRVIERLFGDQYQPVLIKFLKVMASRDRLGYVSAVRAAAETIYDEMMGRVVASVRTAVPLTDELRNQIASNLSGLMNKQVKLNETVDETLIGGMIVRIGDRVFDSSVANQLDKLARKARSGFSAQLGAKLNLLSSDS
jgi:F-type H+-transporting ATPase subunit delta